MASYSGLSTRNNTHLDRTELDVESFGRVFAEKVDNPVEAFVKRPDHLIAEIDDEGRQQFKQVKELGRNHLENGKGRKLSATCTLQA